MNEFHIGKEIEEEVRRQYPSIDAFAKALHRERQTVYDMFKRDQIATDRLMEVSRLLKRDFFKELSAIYSGIEYREDQNLSSLALEEKLYVAKPSEISDIAQEFFSTPRKKPLVMFDISGKHIGERKAFNTAGENALGQGMIKDVPVTSGEISSLGDKIPEWAALPQKAIKLNVCVKDIYRDKSLNECYDDIISLAEKVLAETGKYVIVHGEVPCIVSPHQDYKLAGTDYETKEESCFNVWHERAHIFVADNEKGDFLSQQRLNGSYAMGARLKEVLAKCHAEEDEVYIDDLLPNLFGIHAYDVAQEDLSKDVMRYTIIKSSLIESQHQDPEAFTYYEEIIFDVAKETGKIIGCECHHHKGEFDRTRWKIGDKFIEGDWKFRNGKIITKEEDSSDWDLMKEVVESREETE